jgi:hypothetical protein
MRSAPRPRRITRDRFRDPGPSDGGSASGSGERSPGLPAPPQPIDATRASPRVQRDAPSAAQVAAQAVANAAMPQIQAPPPALEPPPQKIYPRASAPAAAVPERTAPVSRRPPGSQRLMLAAFAVTSCLALAAIIVALQGRSGSEPIVATTPAIRVVETPVQPAELPPPAPVAAELEPAAPEPQEQPVARAGSGEPKKRGPDPRDLTRAFRKQQPQVEACFKQHALGLEGQPRLQLEFDLSAKGKLTGVQLMPATVAGTPLGKCLERIARATSFPAQGEDISFAIPVIASRN